MFDQIIKIILLAFRIQVSVIELNNYCVIIDNTYLYKLDKYRVNH